MENEMTDLQFKKIIDMVIMIAEGCETKEEILEISKHAKKKISLFVFGLVPSLYSRRSLLTNHALHIYLIFSPFIFIFRYITINS